MLARAVKLRQAIDAFTLLNKEELGLDILSNEDWQQMDSLIEYFEAYEHATLSCEGRYATVEKVLPIMEFLLEYLKEGRIKHTEDKFLGPCCEAGWQKLEKYYNKTGESCAYIAAVVLVPSQKWEFFEKGVDWRDSWLQDSKRAVKKLWQEEYKDKQVPHIQLQRPQGDTDSETPENRFKTWSQKHTKVLEVIDEYDRYCREPVIEMDPDNPFDPRKWWIETTQRKMFPNLLQMALDLLSIPAMSAEVERLFSSCKISITDRRNRIGIDAVQAIEFLKNWLRDKAISFIDSKLERGWVDQWIEEVEAETRNDKGKETTW